MICDNCQRIFAKPRKLAFGTYYHWPHNKRSFLASIAAGCSLCNLIWDNLRRQNCEPKERIDYNSLSNLRYAFKALNTEWARFGIGSMWLAPVEPPDEIFESPSVQALASEVEASISHLAKLLETRSGLLEAKSMEYWLVMELYGPGIHVVLPLEEKTCELPQRNMQRIMLTHRSRA
jgi:hypothetical protein